MTRAVHLRADGTGIVLAVEEERLPATVHWGADLGPISDAELDTLVAATDPPAPHSGLDEAHRPRLLPESSRGFAGTPGVQGFRVGERPGPPLRFDELVATSSTQTRFWSEVRDRTTNVSVLSEVEMHRHGVVRLRHSLTNTGDAPYALASLMGHLPLPAPATEVLDLTGRWCRERSPQRRDLGLGSWRRDSRHGRTGHDATLLMVAGTPGFSFGHGEVWGLHVAWSGDHVTFAERLPEGYAQLGGGELLAPGEVVLQPGDRYTMPWLYAVWSGHGLDGLSLALHEHLRDRPHHPSLPRPVVLNTWEAVYFDHDIERLRELADVAAEVGVERFVLDDGWFRNRRNDDKGLGDWYVDEQVWPDGLAPLVEHVTGHGMEFGLWVEPEMISLDSDVARAHPDWVLRARSEYPPSWRSQQVLDLVNPEAYAYIRERLTTLLRDNEISFLKWDHNRDLVDVAHDDAPAVRAQTQATYRLLDEIRSEFPSLEIESCASGGARVDLGILERTDRVWASDCNDALERQCIQRWTGLLLPPELVGSHIGPPVSHTTGRSASLSFRAATALFGHFGMEWDITTCSPEERAELARWIELYKRERQLLHHGTTIRLDRPDAATWGHGVVSQDQLSGLFAVVQMETSQAAVPGRVRLAGLCDEHTYVVEVLDVSSVAASSTATRNPEWLSGGGKVELSGRALTCVGLEMPPLKPESALLLKVNRAHDG